MKSVNRAGRLGGFTLMELMIVIVIVAILAAVALPSYLNQVIKSNRSTGKATLMDVANRQEQFFINAKCYSDDLTELGYPASTFYVDSQANQYDATAADRTYRIQLTASGTCPTTFSVSASPVNRQTKDAYCATYTLASNGTKTVSGTGSASDCW